MTEHYNQHEATALHAHLASAAPINDVVRLLAPHRWHDSSRDYSVRCFLHDDSKPSLRVDQTTNTCRCYGECNRRWDPVQLYAAAKQCTISQAIQELTALLDMDTAHLRRAANILARREADEPDPEECHHNGQRTTEAQDYLAARGLPNAMEEFDCVQWGPYLLIPHKLPGGLICTATCRALNKSAMHRYLTHRSAFTGEIPWGIDKTQHWHGTYVVEGAIDAMSIMAHGRQCLAIRPTAINGNAKLALRDHTRAIIATDPDERGDQAAEMLKRTASGTLTTRARPHAGQDPNDMHLNGTLATWLTRQPHDPQTRTILR